MFARIGYKAIEITTKSIKTGLKGNSITTTESPSVISDIIQIISQRVKNLKIYNANGNRNNLFKFTKDGKINISQRTYGSDDLQFLEHIKNKSYVKPQIYPEGTLPCSQQGIEQSNKLAKEIITENEHLCDGYRYCGSKQKFDLNGKNISRFKNGNQEIVIIDKTIDPILVKIINTFKNRITGKNLTDEQKMDELMKFVDEVFSSSKSSKQTSEYVSYMMQQQQTEVLLGELANSGAGVCRHRALLTKVLADEVNLKCRRVEGYYNNGGHMWNEIITKSDTYLFDAMHGNIFSIGNSSKNIVPQVIPYKITNPKDTNKLISKYFDENSTAGIFYRCLKYKTPIKTSEAILTPTTNGYKIEALTNNVLVNGEQITGVKELSFGDFVNLKDCGFEII